MLKGKKIIFVIVGMIIFCLALGCVSSYAADGIKTITPKNTVKPTTSNTTADEEKEENTVSDENKSTEENKTTNKTTNKITNLNKNTNTDKENSTTNKNSSYSNSNTNKNAANKSELPYAGEGNSSIVFVGIALVASAVYAYKKINEYKNV